VAHMLNIPIASEEKEILPINIGQKNKSHTPGIGFLLAGVALPTTLGLIMLLQGRCNNNGNFSELLCEAPPFGKDAQNIVSIAAGGSLLFEAFANFIKYIIGAAGSYKNKSSAFTESLLLESEAPDDIALKPVSSYRLPFSLIYPYLLGIIDNIVFTLGSVFPISRDAMNSLHTKLEDSHLIPKKLTVSNLQNTNNILNKTFIGVLFANAFAQVSGLSYYTKLVTLVGLVSYVFFRQLTSIESARLIRQQLELKKTLHDLKTFVVDPLKTNLSDGKKDGEWTQFTKTLDKAIKPLGLDNQFLTLEQTHQLLQNMDTHLDEKINKQSFSEDEKNRILHIKNNLIFKSSADAKMSYTNSARFFHAHLPKQPAAVSHSNAVGMGLIILNLFLPPLIAMGTASLTAVVVSNVLLSLATFMPLNGLTEWENDLWGFQKLISGNGDEKPNSCNSFLAFFVVNLPKLQGFSGAAEGVGISVGNTQIALVCESINMVLALVRSLITLPYAIKEACSPAAEQSSIARLARVM